MSDTSHEPSMEETLASIRQIISASEDPASEEVLDLTDMEVDTEAEVAAEPAAPPSDAGLVSANQAEEATAAFSALNRKLNEGYQELPVAMVRSPWSG